MHYVFITSIASLSIIKNGTGLANADKKTASSVDEELVYVLNLTFKKAVT